mmetsp:Transcript_26235/g.45651  ORF Transcript_26235/g.45651 Transcript_26235/m.45651 type:complete len:187 (+) Transcript_26235:152-712(+)
MVKSNDNNKAHCPKKAKTTITKSGGGMDEIDSLFASKKKSHKELQQQISQEKELAKQERKRRKQARLEEEADEFALRGSGAGASSGSAAAGSKKGDSAAPAALHENAKKLSSLTYTRSDVEQLNNSTNKEVKNKWATDGLGGVFNGEGFTGRRDDGGHRVFKAHLMNKDGFGGSADCPFDCDCCFI